MLVVIAAPSLENRRIRNKRSAMVKARSRFFKLPLIRKDTASEEAEYRNMRTFITMKYLQFFSESQIIVSLMIDEALDLTAIDCIM